MEHGAETPSKQPHVGAGSPQGFSERELEWAEPPHTGDLRSKKGVASCRKQTQVHVGALPTPSCVPKLVP